MLNISFSGGLGSAVSALIAHREGLPFRLLFADTLIEDEDLYRFNADVAAAVGQPIIRLADGRTPWGVFRDKRFIGNSRTAHCSQFLKTELVRSWLASHTHIGEELVLGMDWSEQDRIERAAINWAPRPVVSLLNAYKVGRPAYEKWLTDYGLRKPRLYDMGFPHNNCGGFCVRAGLKQFATLLEAMPDRYAYHEEEMERVIAAVGPTARPFLRDRRGGKTRYLTLKQFREEYQAGTLEVDPYDFGGCACFVDEPEDDQK